MKRYKKIFNEGFTLKTINRALEELGYELFKGKGYFYFEPIDYRNSETPQLYDSSIYVNTLNQFRNIDEIKNILQEKIKETEANQPSAGKASGLRIINR